MDPLRIALCIAFYGPKLDCVVDACCCEDIALLDVVHRADPSTLMRAWQFEHWFALAGVPEIDRAVLTGSDESLQIDRPHSVYRIIMALEDYLRLFLSLPGNDLPIEPRSDEVIVVEAIDVQYFCSVFIEGFDESTLREIPLFESEISANRAKIIRVQAKLDPIDRVLMSTQSIDELQGSCVP